MKFPPFLHSHLRLTLLGTPPNRVFFKTITINPPSAKPGIVSMAAKFTVLNRRTTIFEDLRSVVEVNINS